MKVSVSGKQLELGEALKGHVSERLAFIVAKYYENAIDAHVVFSHEAHLIRSECLIHIGTGISLRAQADAADVYASFDAAILRLEKQLRRDKRRRRSHRRVSVRTLDSA
jgi:ribosomal subunit interface protein